MRAGCRGCFSDVKQRVQRLMQQHGIRARGKRRFRVTTTDSRHDLPIAPNLLNRNFTVAAPNRDQDRLADARESLERVS